jgi:hypothetical protein
VETPAEQVDPQRILTETNAEVRREIVRKVGIERVCYALQARVLDTLGEYELLELDAGEGRRYRYLKMHNPSVPEIWHLEGVDNQVATVREALHWRKPEALRNIPVAENGEDFFIQGDVVVWPRDAKRVKEFPKVLT